MTILPSFLRDGFQDGFYKTLTSSALIRSIDISIIPRDMPSLFSSIRTASKAALAYSQMVLLSSGNSALGGSPPSCSNPQTSCQNTTIVQDTCCFNAPGGQLLQVRAMEIPPEVHADDALVDSILGL